MGEGLDSQRMDADGNGAAKTTPKEETEEESLEVSVGLKRKGGISLVKFIRSEVTRGYLPEQNERLYKEKRARVYTFFQIPFELEKFMTYGSLQCVDAFLFTFTFLPVRVALALVTILLHPFSVLWHGPPACGLVLTPAQRCDLLKALLMAVCCAFLYFLVDMSWIYHIIRGQTIIKLYIFFNMLDVGDRLLSSFGQDIMETALWTAAEPKERKRDTLGLIPHVLLTSAYLLVHTVLILLQATTLSVAFNSHSKALLTIMMSNNFVELKGSVFKKFEKRNLFQMSCSDVRERFHFGILLLLVCVRNMTDFNWDLNHLSNLIPDIVIMLFTELLVDAVKHAFITKFNDIQPEVYREYTLSLAHDMISGRQQNAFSDVSDKVTRRMGLQPIPLSCLLIRTVEQSIKISSPITVVCFIVAYLCLVTLKVGISICLLGYAVDLVKNNQRPAEVPATPAKKPMTSRSTAMTPLVTPRKPASRSTPVVTAMQSHSERAGSLSPKPLGDNPAEDRDEDGGHEDPKAEPCGSDCVPCPVDPPIDDLDMGPLLDENEDVSLVDPELKLCGLLKKAVPQLSSHQRSDSNVHLDTLCIDEDLLRVSNDYHMHPPKPRAPNADKQAVLSSTETPAIAGKATSSSLDNVFRFKAIGSQVF